MSMNFTNNIASAKPIIREAANMANDGGGGNLGYMMQGEPEEKKHKMDESIFSQGLKNDIFGFDDNLPEQESFSLAKFVAQIIYTIKSLFNKS